jgi:hypothetical protein
VVLGSPNYIFSVSAQIEGVHRSLCQHDPLYRLP